VARGDGELRDQVSSLLQARHGWRLEPRTTPGAPPTWCFGSGGVSDLSVDVENGALSVYFVDIDREVSLPDADALAASLDGFEALFLGPTSLTEEVLDEVLHGAGDGWGQPET
jgi:hypothetical protein